MFLHYLAESETVFSGFCDVKMSEFFMGKKKSYFYFVWFISSAQKKNNGQNLNESNSAISKQHLKVMRRISVGLWDLGSCSVTGWHYLLCWILPVPVDSQWPASCKHQHCLQPHLPHCLLLLCWSDGLGHTQHHHHGKHRWSGEGRWMGERKRNPDSLKTGGRVLCSKWRDRATKSPCHFLKSAAEGRKWESE